MHEEECLRLRSLQFGSEQIPQVVQAFRYLLFIVVSNNSLRSICIVKKSIQKGLDVTKMTSHNIYIIVKLLKTAKTAQCQKKVAELFAK